MDAEAPILPAHPISATGPSGRDLNVPAVGAALAATIALSIALIGQALKPDDLGWLVGVLGLPMTTVLAWRRAPQVVAASSRRSIARRAIGLAVATIVLTESAIFGLVVVAGVVVATTTGSEALAWLPITIAYSLIFIVVSGLMVALIVVPAALLWAALLRVATR